LISPAGVNTFGIIKILGEIRKKTKKWQMLQ